MKGLTINVYLKMPYIVCTLYLCSVTLEVRVGHFRIPTPSSQPPQLWVKALWRPQGGVWSSCEFLRLRRMGICRCHHWLREGNPRDWPALSDPWDLVGFRGRKSMLFARGKKIKDVFEYLNEREKQWQRARSRRGDRDREQQTIMRWCFVFIWKKKKKQKSHPSKLDKLEQ